MRQDDLSNNKVDILTSIAKAAAGPVPIIGSFITELISTGIPNQRLDRITEFIKVLDKKLTYISFDVFSVARSDLGFISLMEDGFIQAAKAITNDRLDYIANIITNGIHPDKIEFTESKSILNILSQLNDIEIIWLRYYWEPIYDQKFYEKNKAVLGPYKIEELDDDTLTEKQALRNHYKSQLERLGLIKQIYRVNRQSNSPEYDWDGNPKGNDYRITDLGRILLKQIGLVDKLINDRPSDYSIL